MSEPTEPLENFAATSPRKRKAKPVAVAPGANAPEPQAEAGPSEEAVLARLDRGAKYCAAVEQQLSKHVTPEMETIMKLHRVMILKLSTVAEVRPELWDVLKDLMKPVMDWARLQEQRKEREFAEQKYRDQVEAEKAEDAKAAGKPEDETLSPETLERIEFELKLL